MAGRVDEHVGGVGEQRKRVGDERDDHLGRHERNDERERDRERPNLRLRPDAVIVTVVVAHMLSLTPA